MKNYFAIFTALLVSGATAFGYTNVLENVDSQTITNGWDAGNVMIVGDTTSSNTLTIAGGGSLTNINAFVGAQVGASNNTATVSGAGAEWINTGTLQVGASGNSNNTVSVSSGGTVVATSLMVSTNNNFNLNADGNLEIGGNFDAGQSGFNWNDGGSLSVGGKFSGLAVTNLNDADTTIYEGEDKKLTLNGGSWNHGTNNLIIGLEGSGNQLIVTNGGSVTNSDAYVGYSDSANSNSVSVMGTNSDWAVNGTLMVGSTNNMGNSVTVADGGKISAAGLTVNGTNTFNLNTDGNLEISAGFDAGQNGFNWNDGGALSIDGNLSGISEITGSGKTLTLNGGTWTNETSAFTIGTTGSVNSLTIQSGGVVSNANAYVGQNAGADSNSVMVTGSGSSWVNAGGLEVGSAATNSGNRVTVADGGTIVASNLTVHAGNRFDLDRAGTLKVTGDFNTIQDGKFNWNSGGHLSLSNGNLSGFTQIVGSDKTLTLEDGAWLSGGSDLVIGAEQFDNNNAVTGSVSAAGQSLYVGKRGSGNSLTVLKDGTIESDMGYIGDVATAKNNRVTVSGTNSVWNNTADLYVGYHGASNQLFIEDTGRVNSKKGFIGFEAGANGNEVIVSGTNSLWNLSENLYVGSRGQNNTLTIDGGGVVSNGNATVGVYASASNNTVDVTGGGSLWVNAGTLTIGTNGNGGNAVSVSSDGRVEASKLLVHDGNRFNLNAGGTLAITTNFNVSTTAQSNLNWKAGGNLSVVGALTGMKSIELDGAGYSYLDGGKYLTLDGSNATWDVGATNLIVGYESAGAKLMITNGATVTSTNGYIGWGTGSTNNEVLVSEGGTWANTSTGLYVTGSGNALSVASNAWVTVGSYTNALPAGATNGGMVVASLLGAEVVVDDGAQITLASELHIGLSSNETGTVSVQNGGMITAGSLVITNSAFNLNDGGTLAMTDDFNASMVGFNWTNGGHLSIGGDLRNLAGLLETNQTLTIGGTNATWIPSASELVVGLDGNDNQLFIEDGGFVSNLNATVGATSNAWNNAVTVSGSNSVWNNTGTLQIGAVETNGVSLNGGNSVTVSDNGTVIANELTIYTNNYFNLNDGGTLRITGGFNMSDYINTNYTTLNWASGGTLAIEGALSGMATTNLVVEGSTNTYTYLDGGHIVTIGGTTNASWANGGDTNLIVGFNSSDNKLIITNTGTVDNANGFIGRGSDAKDNSVLVSGAGSTWTNRKNLYVGGYAGSNSWNNAGANNSLTVSNGGWVFVGDSATNLTVGHGGGIGVASTNGAELVVGNGSITAEQGLHIGVDMDQTGAVTIRDNGTAILSELNIATNSELNLYGTLKMTGAFDVSDYINSSFTNLNWNNGGDLVMVNSDLSGISGLTGSNKTVTIEGGSWSNATLLSIDGYNNKLTISSNSLVTSTDGYIGTTTNDLNNSVVVSGSNSVWQNSRDLFVGDAGSGNTLTILDGGFVTNMNAYIGNAITASNNTVTVDGSNSVWGISDDLYVGRTGSNSTLTVKNDASVVVGKDLFVQNGSTLDLASTNATIDVGGDMTVNDSTVSGTGTIDFGDGDNTLFIIGTNSSIGTSVKFDGQGGTDAIKLTNSVFAIDGSLSNRFVNFDSLLLEDSTLSGSGTLDGIREITMDGGILTLTDTLKIDGEFTATNQPLLKLTAGEGSLELTNTNAFDLLSLGAEVTISNNATPGTFDEVILTADGGLTGSFASTNFIEHFLLYDFTLSTNETQVSVVSEKALDGEISSALTYAGIQGIRAGFNGMQNAAFVRTKQLRRNSVATDQAISHEAFLMQNADAPNGPQGPGDQNTIFGMHFWAEQFSGQGDYDSMGNSDGFTLNNNGTSFGFDRLFGDSLVAGINYTYARSAASATGGDRSDTETYWLGLYAEWFAKSDYYLEGLLALGWSDYETIRTDTGYRGEGSFRGNDFGGHIEGGKYFHRKNWALAPYAGLNYLGIKSEAYTETDLGGGPSVDVDEQSVASLESALGVKLRHRFDTTTGRFQTVGYAEWAYDFINDDIGSSLSDGTISVGTARIAPGASVVNAGVGLSWICTDYLEVGLGYDGRFNENYEEHTGTIMFDVRF